MISFSDIPAIDSHGHYGPYRGTGPISQTDRFMTATAPEVAKRALNCGVEQTLVSPSAGLFPRHQADAVSANEAAFREVPEVPGLLQYVIVNPLQPQTFDQARRMLQASWCVGIKIHPEEHDYRISDQGEALFTFFEEVQAPVMTHSGCPNSLPADFVPFADRHPGVRLLLAHLGNGAGDAQRADLQVRAVAAARHGNIWVDTSSARNVMPNLIEWAISELGPERLLFGSDTPLYHIALQRVRIEAAEIPAAAKRLILRENALRFFKIPDVPKPLPDSIQK
jgi:hypothetical protein